MEIVINENFGKSEPSLMRLMRSWDPMEICDFHQTIGNTKTPLIHLPQLAKNLGIQNILVKDESCRFGLNSFKPLGASYAMKKQIKNNPNIEIFCTATDGNHGRSVAWMARKLGKKSVIYVPSGTTESRIEAIKEEGAKVQIVNDSYDMTVKKARLRCQEENQSIGERTWSLVQDTSWDGYTEIPLNIMKGYWTQVHEITNQLRDYDVDIIFLQTGVGSWAASIVSYIMIYWKNPPIIISVEPLSANCLFQSIKKGSRVSVNNKKNTIMAGLDCGTVSLMAWPMLRNYIRQSISISDRFTKKAMNVLANPSLKDHAIVAGESGAAGLAGLLALYEMKNSKRIKENKILGPSTTALLINTEGATDPINYNIIIGSED